MDVCFDDSQIQADTVRRLKSIRIFTDASNEPSTIMKLCWHAPHGRFRNCPVEQHAEASVQTK